MTQSRNDKRKDRARRVRARISGTSERPRLCVFRSLTQFSAQIIDDTTGTTLVSAQTTELGKGKNTVAGAAALAAALAKKAAAKKITSVVFDRAGYRYHGKVKAFADAAREAGLLF